LKHLEFVKNNFPYDHLAVIMTEDVI